jgi:hypothetical protein
MFEIKISQKIYYFIDILKQNYNFSPNSLPLKKLEVFSIIVLNNETKETKDSTPHRRYANAIKT